MQQPTPPTYGLMALGLALAAGLRVWLPAAFAEPVRLLPLLLAVAACAWLGGLGWGFVATFCGAAVDVAAGGAQAATFTVQGALVAVLGDARRRSAREAAARTEALRKLTAHLALAEERQRRHIAEELHEHLQHLLLACRMRIAATGKAGERSPALADVDDLLAQSLEFTRTLAAELSPPVLSRFGLFAALQWLAPHMEERFGLRVEVSGDEDAEPDGEDARVLVFHAVRELLLNVVKHARTERAFVTVRRDGPDVRVTVEDRGVGCDLAADPAGGGIGLFSIRERLAASGGRLETASAPDRGTRMTLVVPARP